MRIEFTYRRGPDHFAGFPTPAARGSSPVTSHLIAAVIGLAGAALTIASLIGDGGPTATTYGVRGLLLGGGIAVAADSAGA